MGSADIPCELSGEFAEFDDILRIEEELQDRTESGDQREFDLQNSVEVLQSQTLIPAFDRALPAPDEDRSAAFKRPRHLLSPQCDSDFVIFAALTRSGQQIYDNGWYGSEALELCEHPSSPQDLPAKYVIALNSKEGPDGGCGGALRVPGVCAISGSHDSPWTAWTFSDALSMWASVTGRSPQTFYAAVQWSTVFNEDAKRCTRVTDVIGNSWNSEDYFDTGPITRSEQFPDLLEYLFRGQQKPLSVGEFSLTDPVERTEEESANISLLRFVRAIDGGLAREGLKDLDNENYDIALWEYWNDYGNMHNHALRSLFPIKGAYKLRSNFLPAFLPLKRQTNASNPDQSTSEFESLPSEVLLQILSSSTVTPVDLMCVGGASRRLRSLLLLNGRVDTLTKDFIHSSAPWLLPNTTDWWDCGGYEDYGRSEQINKDKIDADFFELKLLHLNVPDQYQHEKMRVQKARQRASSEQKIWKDWIAAETRCNSTEKAPTHAARPDSSFCFPSNFPWLAYYLLATSTRRTKFGRETNYAYSSSMRNRKRIYHIIKNIERLVVEAEIDPEKPLNFESLQKLKSQSEAGKERFRSWPEGTPRPDFGQFLTYQACK